MIGDHIPLEKLPLNDLLGFLEINPPRLPYKSLVGGPGTPVSLLNEFVVDSNVTGFSVSLSGQQSPKVYAHLLCVFSIRSTGTSSEVGALTFNADNLFGNGHYSWNSTQRGLSSTADLVEFCNAPGPGSVSPCPGFFVVPDYLGGNVKSLLCFGGRASGVNGFDATSAVWTPGVPITQVDFKTTGGSNIASGSRFSFYALGAQ